jgi:hypothetical protein
MRKRNKKEVQEMAANGYKWRVAMADRKGTVTECRRSSDVPPEYRGVVQALKEDSRDEKGALVTARDGNYIIGVWLPQYGNKALEEIVATARNMNSIARSGKVF